MTNRNTTYHIQLQPTGRRTQWTSSPRTCSTVWSPVFRIGPSDGVSPTAPVVTRFAEGPTFSCTGSNSRSIHVGSSRCKFNQPLFMADPTKQDHFFKSEKNGLTFLVTLKTVDPVHVRSHNGHHRVRQHRWEVRVCGLLRLQRGHHRFFYHLLEVVHERRQAILNNFWPFWPIIMLFNTVVIKSLTPLPLAVALLKDNPLFYLLILLFQTRLIKIWDAFCVDMRY